MNKPTERKWRHFSNDQRAAMVRRHLGDKVPVSDSAGFELRGLEKLPRVTMRVIGDNGPPFIARDFKSFVRIVGLTHVPTSSYHPKRNGTLERWHASLKQERIPPIRTASLTESRKQVQDYGGHYKHGRRHLAHCIGRFVSMIIRLN